MRGVREAEELSEAMTGMLSRLAAAQQATTNSLQAAQDFAANAAHELRTPLTAMRADLDTLRIHDLPAEERAEVVDDLSRAQRRVEAIITALGQLASGELAQAEDREVIDVTDMLDRVARENMRPSGSVEIVVEADEDLGTIWGWPGGLRLAVDNLVRNAVTHGPATRIVLAAVDRRRTDVDDDHRRRQRPRAARRRTQQRCWADSRAEAPPRRAVRDWGWRWSLSRRHCTAAASSCPTVRSAGCGRP